MDAYKAGILHRDFSPGNIIIVSHGRGLLIDWDLSKPLSMKLETPRRATRTVRTRPSHVVAKANMRVQGTWQFMSSKLISQPIWQHDFRDDLESSIYVLLWVTLMYSSCSDAGHVVPFMEGVLDPQPHGTRGGLGKADFLQGRSFLRQVDFPNRPTLHTLLDRMAHLFSVRYEAAPNASERKRFEKLLMLAQKQPDEMADDVRDQSHVASYDQRVDALNGHEVTIELFNDALADRSQWPTADHAVKQDIYALSNLPRAGSQTLKTGWSTSFIVHEMEGDSSSGNDDDLFQVNDEFSETSDSDQITVAGNSPTLSLVGFGA